MGIRENHRYKAEKFLQRKKRKKYIKVLESFKFKGEVFCNACSTTRPSGICNWIKHVDNCPKDAPSSDVLSHYRKIEREERQAIFDARWKRVEALWTREECDEYYGLIIPFGHMNREGEWEVITGTYGMNLITTFQNKMFKKYKV